MMLNIASEPMATPIANLRRAKKVRSTNGGLTRASTASSRTNAAAASANGPMTESGAARACGNACRANTSDTINVISRIKPSQSARRLSPLDARAAAARAQAWPAIAPSMSATLNQKITRQPRRTDDSHLRRPHSFLQAPLDAINASGKLGLYPPPCGEGGERSEPGGGGADPHPQPLPSRSRVYPISASLKYRTRAG